jgi:cytochrome c peroxidase
VQEMRGPVIPWRPGRQDQPEEACTPDGRLPDGSKAADHIRNVFGRMGFDDQEMVALSGAHAVGRCHRERSGFEGPWTFSPTVFTNDYFRLLLEENWDMKEWEGPRQWEDRKTKSLMMLPTDYALVEDKGFRVWVERYAEDSDRFFGDFAKVLVKLLELGVPFRQEERWVFKSTLDREAEEEAAEAAKEQKQREQEEEKGGRGVGLGVLLGSPQGAAA